MRKGNSNSGTNPTHSAAFLQMKRRFYTWSPGKWRVSGFPSGKHHGIFPFPFPWPSYFSELHGGKTGSFKARAHEQIDVVSACSCGSLRMQASWGPSRKPLQGSGGGTLCTQLDEEEEAGGKGGRGRPWGKDTDLKKAEKMDFREISIKPCWAFF